MTQLTELSKIPLFLQRKSHLKLSVLNFDVSHFSKYNDKYVYGCA